MKITITNKKNHDLYATVYDYYGNADNVKDFINKCKKTDISNNIMNTAEYFIKQSLKPSNFVYTNIL